MSALALALPLAMAGALAPGTPAAQDGPGRPPEAPERAAVTSVDSVRILRRARKAQASFESTRRRHFPTVLGYPARCDERIGRFCIDHDDEGGDGVPEPRAVREARRALLEELAGAAAAIPGDGWIAGQRVRYLLEDGRADAALRLTRRCAIGRPAWCAALAGYVLHTTGDFHAADSAFAEMTLATDAERCEWDDISVLLHATVAGTYRALPCTGRDVFHARFWWLADPLWLVPGNDRRTEHYARRVIDRLQRDAESAFDVPWEDDTREIVLRYGWPSRWVAARDPGSPTGGWRVLAYHPPASRHFVPPPGALAEPTGIMPASWPLDPPAPPTAYAPPHVSSLDPLDHQVAVFRRGDSAVVVAAYDVGGGGGWPATGLHAALFLIEHEGARPIVRMDRDAGRRGVFSARVSARPTVLGLEALAPGGGPAARARYGLRTRELPPLVLGASDLLVLSDAEPLPGSLAEAIPRARGSLRLPAGEPIGLYWEIYAAGPDAEALSLSIETEREAGKRGFFGTLAESFGLTSDENAVALHWEESLPGGAGVHSRSLALDLPRLSEGDYTLKLVIAAAGREPITVARRLRVEGGS